jgi:CheY-like chemotaxis protein
MLTLINDILDFSKVEAGKMTLELQPFDLRQLIQSTVKFMTPRAASKHIAFNTSLDGLPQVVMGDPTRLQQVLLNLIGNAIKFTEFGSVTVHGITESETDTHVSVLLSVTDTGIGLSDEQAKRLFQPFNQADSSTTRKYGGTGLGLAICKRLVELMKGEIGLESALGQGARFWMRLVFEKKATLPAPRNNAPAEKTSARNARNTQKHTILVVEDSSVNQKVVVLQLKELGYRADAVANGNEAIEALERVPYSLVLMDCYMPEMDGYTATAKIRAGEKDGHRTPIIAMTANVMSGDRSKCLAAGMDDYLSKPIKTEDLRAILDRWCRAPEKPAKKSDFSLDDPKLYQTLLKLYMKQSAHHMKNLEAGIKEKDMGACKLASHTLRGSSGTIGFAKMRELSEAIEAIIDRKSFDGIEPLFEQLQNEFESVKEKGRAHENIARG